MPVVPSPAVPRIARLLETLARDPDQELTLTELSRRSGISKPTTHSLLLAMVAEGFVQRRHPQPTYRLGPALVPLGEAARACVTIADVADADLGMLSDSAQSCAIVGTVDGGEIVVSAARCVPHPFGYTVTVGARLAFRPPMGSIYVAWADEPTIRSWMDRAVPALTSRRVRALRNDLASIRTRGWSMTIRDLSDGKRAIREARQADLVGDSLSVIGISAPVWDARGQLVCSIAVMGFTEPLGAEEWRELITKVTQAAARVTGKLLGQPPPSASPGW